MEGTIRVLLFTDSNVFAGTERHILELACGLIELGAVVRIGCPKNTPLANKADERKMSVVSIAKGGLVDTKAILTLKRLLQAKEIDLIHAHNGRTAFSAAVAVWLAGVGRCVFTQHFLEPSRVGRRGVKAWLSALVYRWVNRHIHHFIAISEAVKTGILQRREASDRKITVIPNGISLPDRGGLSPVRVVRTQFGVGDGDPLIVCAARLEKEKDIASLVEAMAIVRKSIPRAMCIVAGDGSEREGLLSRIKTLGLERHMLIPGFYEDALSLIHASDLFVLPSLAEPFGLVLLEAMALGKPVIATRAGGPVEIVTRSTGQLVTPATPSELAAGIVTLLNNRALRESMGGAGYRRFLERFTAGRMAAAVFATYKCEAFTCASC